MIGYEAEIAEIRSLLFQVYSCSSEQYELAKRQLSVPMGENSHGDAQLSSLFKTVSAPRRWPRVNLDPAPLLCGGCRSCALATGAPTKQVVRDISALLRARETQPVQGEDGELSPGRLAIPDGNSGCGPWFNSCVRIVLPGDTLIEPRRRWPSW